MQHTIPEQLNEERKRKYVHKQAKKESQRNVTYHKNKRKKRKKVNTIVYCANTRATRVALSHSDEHVLLPCLNAQPDIFAVMNCCVVALSAFSSDILTWSADILVYIQCQWRTRGGGWIKAPLELDILQNLYYLHKED